METIGNGGGGALVAIVASLMAIIKSQPNFDHGRFKEEISTLIEHPNTTEIQKTLDLFDSATNCDLRSNRCR
jgi:hypothetical protein